MTFALFPYSNTFFLNFKFSIFTLICFKLNIIQTLDQASAIVLNDQMRKKI